MPGGDNSQLQSAYGAWFHGTAVFPKYLKAAGTIATL